MFIFEVVKLPLYTSGTIFINYKSKVKAFTFERLPHLLLTVTKISTLYNFYHCRVLADRLAAILRGETELALGTLRVKIFYKSFHTYNINCIERRKGPPKSIFVFKQLKVPISR